MSKEYIDKLRRINSKQQKVIKQAVDMIEMRDGREWREVESILKEGLYER